MKEEKKILRPPDWPQFRPPAGQETNFFLGWPGGEEEYRHEGPNVESLDGEGGGGSPIFFVSISRNADVLCRYH